MTNGFKHEQVIQKSMTKKTPCAREDLDIYALFSFEGTYLNYISPKIALANRDNMINIR